MRPGEGYEIVVLPDGQCDVLHNGRAYAYDLQDVDAALDLINLAVGETMVQVVDRDGYRMEVSTR